MRVSSIFHPIANSSHVRKASNIYIPEKWWLPWLPRTRPTSRTASPHRRLALPYHPIETPYGYLSEHHSFGETEDSAGDYAEELAAEMLATTLNVDFDPDRSWDEKKEIYRISNKIVRTANVTQSAVGDKARIVDDSNRVGSSDLRLATRHDRVRGRAECLVFFVFRL